MHMMHLHVERYYIGIRSCYPNTVKKSCFSTAIKKYTSTGARMRLNKACDCRAAAVETIGKAAQYK